MLHLYYKNTESKQLSDVTKAFESCETFDISKSLEVKHDAVYLVEIQNIEKTLLTHIKKLLSDKTDSLIYFFTKESHNLMLFQLASLLNVKSIITPKHETQKIISSIKEDILLKKTNAQNRDIVDTLSKNSSFMIFRAHSLIFASKKLLSDFKCKSLEMLSLNICPQIDLKIFLQKDIDQEVNITVDEKSKKYNIKSASSKLNSDRYIFVKEASQKKSTSNIDFIKNRIYFIEILKNRLLEKNTNDNICSIITISIENIKNMRNFWSEYEVEMAVRDLLLQAELEIDADTILAQYDDKLYLALFENLDFEATKQKANNLQTHILAYTSKEEIKPTIDLHVFDVNGYELNNALKVISDIAKGEISSKDIESQKIHKIINLDSQLNDEEAIDMFLQTAFTNKTPIKLLNTYKGLCINTDSKIVKKTDYEIYVSFEQLQGIVMNFKKDTVIQSPSFTKDIAADVKLIDLKKKIALLRNFRFVDGSANGRKYSRVTSSQRTPVSIINPKGSLNGEILDISMNSIAIKTRFFKQIEKLNSTDAVLKFTLPVKSSEDGYMKLELAAKVALTKCDEDYCKIVVDLEQDQAHESILMEYVYDRQKEIIAELKKQTIMRS